MKKKMKRRFKIVHEGFRAFVHGGDPHDVCTYKHITNIRLFLVGWEIAEQEHSEIRYCPHCKAPSVQCIPERVFRCIEAYGSAILHFPCEKCGKMVRAWVTMRVIVQSLTESDRPIQEGDI